MPIVRIKNKGLSELWRNGRSARVSPKLQRNAMLIMDYLNRMKSISDCFGFKGFHRLSGDRKDQFTMHVSGNWCIIFEIQGTDVTILDLEDYH